MMPFEIAIIEEDDLPFKPGAQEQSEFFAVASELDEDAIADGETEPFPWIDLDVIETEPERLIDPDEPVLKASEATLVLSYPLSVVVTRTLTPRNGDAFRRSEILVAVNQTYRQIYAEEEASQSDPTPPVEERGQTDPNSPTYSPEEIAAAFSKLAKGRDAFLATGGQLSAEVLHEIAIREGITPILEYMRSNSINRPRSDGTYGIWGHDIGDLGIGGVEIHKIGGRSWLYPHIES